MGGILSGLGNLFGGGDPNNVVNEGLGGLLEHFRERGQGQTAESWVNTGPNQAIGPDDLEKAIGPDVLDALVKQTGLSRQELLTRLSQRLPEAVDKYTPDGRIPGANPA